MSCHGEVLSCNAHGTVTIVTCGLVALFKGGNELQSARQPFKNYIPHIFIWLYFRHICGYWRQCGFYFNSCFDEIFAAKYQNFRNTALIA